VDQFLVDHPESMILYSAGNNGKKWKDGKMRNYALKEKFVFLN
jgi:hypothetical protein